MSCMPHRRVTSGGRLGYNLALACCQDEESHGCTSSLRHDSQKVHCTTARLTEEVPGTGLSCVVPTPAEAAAVCVFRCRPLPLRRALTGTACQILRSAASADPRPDRGAASTPDPGPQPTGGRSNAPASPKGLQRCHQPVNPERSGADMTTDEVCDIQLWVGECEHLWSVIRSG